MPSIKASRPEVKIQNPELCSEAPYRGYTRHEALWNGTQTTSPQSGGAELRGKCWKKDEKLKKFSMAELQHPIRPSFHSSAPNRLWQHFFHRQNKCPLQCCCQGRSTFNSVIPHPTHCCIPTLHRGDRLTFLCNCRGFEPNTSHSWGARPSHGAHSSLPPSSLAREGAGWWALLMPSNK